MNTKPKQNLVKCGPLVPQESRNWLALRLKKGPRRKWPDWVRRGGEASFQQWVDQIVDELKVTFKVPLRGNRCLFFTDDRIRSGRFDAVHRVRLFVTIGGHVINVSRLVGLACGFSVAKNENALHLSGVKNIVSEIEARLLYALFGSNADLIWYHHPLRFVKL
jgi:hypothetical protein